MYGKYCRGLHCPICNGIRKAELINKYYPFIKSWTDAYFVTITAKAVSAGSLSKRVNQMIKGFQKIKNTINKRHKRGKGVKFYGIKSLECNFNPLKRTYNPHFHFIFPNKECAEVFMNEWLQRLPVRLANPKGQHIRKVESTERDMMETIKYGSKIFTDPKGSEKNHKNITPFVYASALDNIIWALKGHRLFERFGFDLPKHSKRKIEPQQLENYREWEFDTNLGYWLELGTDEKISDYQISSELYALLSDNINLALE
ncbi:MAG: protein rep [Crocinitomicaceae bacterium]|nr:protein rep [Crocinitomicaceae bacterium]